MSRMIQAVAIGRAVPGEFQATVHSVFKTAANLAVTGLEHLITLIASDSVDLPQGIRLSAIETDAIVVLEPGLELFRQGDMIWSSQYPYKIDLRGVRQYDGVLACPGVEEVPDQGKLEAYQLVKDLLAQRQEEKQAALRILDLGKVGNPGATNGTAVHHLTQLAHAAEQQDLYMATHSMHSLVGLGGGLTPTGDDVLVGFMAGLQVFAGESPDRNAWIEQFREKLRIESLRTNDISRSYIVLAADGQYSSSLVNLVHAICFADALNRVREAAENAFQVGHTSGLDVVTGLLAGLSVWSIYSNSRLR